MRKAVESGTAVGPSYDGRNLVWYTEAQKYRGQRNGTVHEDSPNQPGLVAQKLPPCSDVSLAIFVSACRDVTVGSMGANRQKRSATGLRTGVLTGSTNAFHRQDVRPGRKQTSFSAAGTNRPPVCCRSPRSAPEQRPGICSSPADSTVRQPGQIVFFRNAFCFTPAVPARFEGTTSAARIRCSAVVEQCRWLVRAG